MAETWRTLSPAAIKNALPETGEHQGAIIGVKVIDKPTEVWLMVNYGLRAHAEEIQQLHCIAAAPTSPHRHRVADGLRSLNRTIKAAGLTLKSPKPEHLPALLAGAKLTLRIGIKEADGIPELILKGVSPPREGE